MRKFKAVGFDRTGVILGKSSSAFAQEISTLLNVTVQDFRVAYRNHNYAFNSGAISLEELWKKVLVELHKERFLSQALAITQEPKVPNEAVFDIIRELKQVGCKVGLLSNDSKEAAKHMREIEHLDTIFDVFLVSGETGLVKPKPEAYIDLMEKLGVHANELLFIDDTKINLNAAQELGIGTIFFENAAALRDQLTQQGLL